ncbi:MAG: hypothetical protein V4629_02000 [Pseudomonadota bacterium]
MRRPLLISIFIVFGCIFPGLASAEYSSQDYYPESEENSFLKSPSIIQTFSKKPLEILASMIQLVAPTSFSQADYLQQFSDNSYSNYLNQNAVPSVGFRFGTNIIENDSTGIGLQYYFH